MRLCVFACVCLVLASFTCLTQSWGASVWLCVHACVRAGIIYVSDSELGCVCVCVCVRVSRAGITYMSDSDLGCVCVFACMCLVLASFMCPTQSWGASVCVRACVSCRHHLRVRLRSWVRLCFVRACACVCHVPASSTCLTVPLGLLCVYV